VPQAVAADAHQPASRGFELRIYYCASSATSDRVIAPLRVAAVLAGADLVERRKILVEEIDQPRRLGAFGQQGKALNVREQSDGDRKCLLLGGRPEAIGARSERRD
jgi:hypothetical protein